MKTIEQWRASLPKRERRLMTGRLELRTAADSPPKIGMRIPFGKESCDLGFIEIIDPGAFTKSLQERGADVVALWSHDPACPLGRQSNGTFDVRETASALEGVVTLDPANQWHMGCYAPAVARGDVAGASFGFETIRDSWEFVTDDTGNTTATRTLLEVKLYEMSAVVFPAYPDSAADSRAIAHRRSLDLAAVRGIDPVELAAVLNGAEGGLVAPKHVESVRRWIGRLQTLLPAEEPKTMSIAMRRRRLALLERMHGLAANG